MPLGTALPFGIRDVKLVPYSTLAATELGSSMLDLPNIQTFSWTDTEEYTDLRGDDSLVTSHGAGSQVEWEMTAGGMSIPAYTAINGGTVIETGVTPNQVQRYRKSVDDQRPFFTAMGQAISDAGGDFHGIVWLCRSTGEVGGELTDGEFLTPTFSGLGFPCRVDGEVEGETILRALYDFVHNETITSLAVPALDTPSAPIVSSLTPSTGATAGGELVRIRGQFFTGATAVTVDATGAEFTILNDREIVFVTPADAAGTVDVTVTNATGTSATGPTTEFTYA